MKKEMVAMVICTLVCSFVILLATKYTDTHIDSVLIAGIGTCMVLGIGGRMVSGVDMVVAITLLTSGAISFAGFIGRRVVYGEQKYGELDFLATNIGAFIFFAGCVLMILSREYASNRKMKIAWVVQVVTLAFTSSISGWIK